MTRWTVDNTRAVASVERPTSWEINVRHDLYLAGFSWTCHACTLCPLSISSMVRIEDITDSQIIEAGCGADSAIELKRTLKALSARLALPEELLPSFLEEDKRQSLGVACGFAR